MKITDEAVKAALEAFWDNEDEPIMTGMKRALEAAAPHMLAGAWEVAYGQGVEDERTSAYSGTNYGPNRNNPYEVSK